MKARLFLALAAAALMLPPVAAPAQRGAAAQRDWTRTVIRTPEGGYRMGNPNAPLKVVEYGSITCSHCADFSEQASATLRANYIRSGRMSFEYRPYLLFPTDPGAFVLLNCLGPARFFAASEQLYATQAAWVARVRALPQAEHGRIAALPELQQFAAYARAAGFDQFFRRHGMTAARINACLADPAGYRRLSAITTAAEQAGVQGTPTFVVNGRLVGPQEWSTLEPMLQPPAG